MSSPLFQTYNSDKSFTFFITPFPRFHVTLKSARKAWNKLCSGKGQVLHVRATYSRPYSRATYKIDIKRKQTAGLLYGSPTMNYISGK